MSTTGAAGGAAANGRTTSGYGSTCPRVPARSPGPPRPGPPVVELYATGADPAHGPFGGVQTVFGCLCGASTHSATLAARQRCPPRRSFPRLGHVDPLAPHPLAVELEQADAHHPRAAVVAGRHLSHPHVAGAADAADAELDGHRVLLAPLAEVGHPLEALSRLGKLQDGVVVVQLVGALGVADVLPLLEDGGASGLVG